MPPYSPELNPIEGLRDQVHDVTCNRRHESLDGLERTLTTALRPLWVPMWIGPGVKYADFTWRDASIYQIFIDRFLDADPSNNINNGTGDLARVIDRRSQW